MHQNAGLLFYSQKNELFSLKTWFYLQKVVIHYQFYKIHLYVAAYYIRIYQTNNLAIWFSIYSVLWVLIFGNKVFIYLVVWFRSNVPVSGQRMFTLDPLSGPVSEREKNSPFFCVGQEFFDFGFSEKFAIIFLSSKTPP